MPRPIGWSAPVTAARREASLAIVWCGPLLRWHAGRMTPAPLALVIAEVGRPTAPNRVTDSTARTHGGQQSIVATVH